jgi:hypothetical protein
MRNSAAVEDEDLSREALSFLYGELLPDPDSQNFVQRLSVLVGPRMIRFLKQFVAWNQRSGHPPLCFWTESSHQSWKVTLTTVTWYRLFSETSRDNEFL